MYHDFAATIGGYSVVQDDAQNHPRLLQAAEFAVTEAIALDKYSFLSTSAHISTSGSGAITSGLPPFVICKAYQQVVAGMNLRMVIQIQDDQGSCLGAFATTVYDRFGDLSVTAWSPSPVSCEIAQQMLSGAYVAAGALESFFDRRV
jgi:hypothetical protein